MTDLAVASFTLDPTARKARPAPVWRFYACSIAGGAPLTVRDELPLANVSIVDRLKGAGALTASLPLRHPKATPQNLDTENTLLVAERDGVVVWAGPLLSVDLSLDAENLSIQADGAWNLIRRRVIRSAAGMVYGTVKAGEVTFTNRDQFLIVADLIAHMNTVRNDLAVTVAYPALSNQARDRTYEADKAKSIGEAIEQLSDVSNGFDWALEPNPSIDDIGFTLRLAHPYRGRDTGYRLDWAAPVRRTSTTGSRNILAIGLSESSRERIARFSAIGPGEGASQFVAHASDETAALLPMTEAGSSWQDVSQPATLTAHAERHTAMHSRKVLVPTFRLDPQAEPTLGSWIVGDIFDCSIDDGWAQIQDGKYRAIGRTINLDGDGTESVDVDMIGLGRWTR